MGKVISLQVDAAQYYRGYLNLAALFQPYKSLLSREQDVLVELYITEYTLINSGVKESDMRDSLIFSTANRKKITDKLQISNEALSTYLCQLRSKGFLTKENVLIRERFFSPEKDNTLTITFVLK